MDKRPATRILSKSAKKIKKKFMAKKTATTLSLDVDIKTEFKIECVKNGVEMSETVEFMMLNYIKCSKNIRDAK